MTFGRAISTIAFSLLVVAAALAPGWTLAGTLCASAFIVAAWAIAWDMFGP